MNASGDASETVPSHGSTSLGSHVAMPHTVTPCASSAGVHLVVDHPAVAHDDERGMRSPSSAPNGPPPGTGSDVGRAELVGGHRPVPLEVELVDRGE